MTTPDLSHSASFGWFATVGERQLCARLEGTDKKAAWRWSILCWDDRPGRGYWVEETFGLAVSKQAARDAATAAEKAIHAQPALAAWKALVDG